MEKCKFLKESADVVADCPRFLSEDDIILLLDSLGNDLTEFGQELTSFIHEHNDINFENYFLSHYRKIRNSLRIAKKDLKIRHQDDILVVDGR